MTASDHRVLIVDDEEHVRGFLASALTSAGFTVEAVDRGEEAVRRFQDRPYEVVVSDLRMPGKDGYAVLREVREVDPDAVVVILTGYGSVENAVTLMREGAFSILTKPCAIQDVLVTVEKGMRHHELSRRNRELSSQLERSQRLAMIGKLAAGVAHELNSPLDGVLRFVNLSLGSLEPGHEVRDWLEECRRGLERMASIVRSLLTFSRNVVLEHEEVGLRELLGEAVRTTRAVLGDRPVTIEVGDVPSDLKVPKALYQVFMNVLKNAADATEGPGRVLAEAVRHEGDLEIRVTDEGSGVPPGIRDRIFEPFFTTKEAGRGTGLGLPICARIMERFNGKIQLADGPEGGTIVTLRLPLHREARLPTLSES